MSHSETNIDTIEREFGVGRFMCKMRMDARGKMSMEWSPDIPGKGQLSAADLVDYLRERNAVVSEFCRRTGRRVAILDL